MFNESRVIKMKYRKNAFLTLMPLGPVFPTGPGKPYMEKMEKHTQSKIKTRLSLFKKSFIVFDLIRYSCCAPAHFLKLLAPVAVCSVNA